jgi:membrane-associated phospholipid phosphatase
MHSSGEPWSDPGSRARFGRTGWRAALCLLTLTVAFLLDDEAAAWVGRSQQDWLQPLAAFIRRYGDWPWLVGGSLLALLLADRMGAFSARRLAWRMVVLTACAGLTVTALRSVTGRTRPNANVQQGWYGPRHDGQWLVGKPAYNSFPSGHTGAATGFATAVALGSRRRRWIWLFPIVMGLTRVYQHAHHLSDVVAAGWLGWGVARFAYFRLWHRALAPWPVEVPDWNLASAPQPPGRSPIRLRTP